jgi:hypothetical protein
MASPVANLFLRLHKWAARQDENFLTESLAVVLEQLLALAPEVGTRLVARLTGGFIDLPPTAPERSRSALRWRLCKGGQIWRSAIRTASYGLR